MTIESTTQYAHLSENFSTPQIPVFFLKQKMIAMLTFLPLISFSSICTNRTFSLMLDPAGDAQHSGRMIHNMCERGITLQCAEKIKKKIEEENGSVRVILTRFPGEIIEPLQNAHFANRLDIDLYISIHFYQETETKPKMHIYYVNYNDQFITKTYDFCFYPYDQAHRIHNTQTKYIIQQCNQSFKDKKFARLYDYKGVFGLPIKPLIGIKAPAFMIEMSIKDEDGWQQYIEPICFTLSKIIQSYE